jgi:hypothetical protein
VGNITCSNSTTMPAKSSKRGKKGATKARKLAEPVREPSHDSEIESPAQPTPPITVEETEEPVANLGEATVESVEEMEGVEEKEKAVSEENIEEELALKVSEDARKTMEERKAKMEELRKKMVSFLVVSALPSNF